MYIKMRDKSVLQSTFVAVAMGRQSDGQMDEDSYRSHLRRLVQGGVLNVAVACTTGGGPALTLSEWKKVVSIPSNEITGIRGTIAGCYGESVAEVLQYVKIATAQVNTTACLIPPPCSSLPTQEGIYQFYKGIIEGVPDCRIIVYNNPGRTGCSIDTETVLRLIKSDNIVGIKESSGNWARYMELKERCPDDFALMTGNDEFAVDALLNGFTGTISVISNLFPAEMIDLYKISADGHTDEAKNKEKKYIPLIAALGISANPVPLIFLLYHLGHLKANVVSLPLVPLELDLQDAVVKAYELAAAPS